MVILIIVLFTTWSAHALVNSTPVASVPSEWIDGDGGTITTVNELIWLSETSDAWDETWILGADIDATGSENWNGYLGFSPIGNSSQPFSGSFYGKGYTISNLTITRPDETYVGFVGYADDATLANITLEGVDYSGNRLVGSLVGYMKNSAIIHCQVSGAVRGKYHTGGLSGSVYNSIIMSSSSAVSVRSRAVFTQGDGKYTGGLVGYLRNSTVMTSFSSGIVVATSNAGGFLGNATWSDVINNFSTGSVSSLDQTKAISGFVYSAASGVIDKNYTMVHIESGTEENRGGIMSYRKSSYSAAEFTDTWYDAANGANGAGHTDVCPAEDLECAKLETGAFALEATFPEWDFDTVWEIATIPEIDAAPRPYLQWQQKDMYVAVATNNNERSTVSGSRGYDSGETATLGVTTKSGYVFGGWYLNGVLVSDVAEYSFTVTGAADRTLVAKIEKEESFPVGDGTEGSPYQISTLYQLEALSNRIDYHDKHFLMTADIDASDTRHWNLGSDGEPRGFIPIGRYRVSSFTGSFNGGGYTLSNLYINAGGYVGMFGVADGAVIRSLTLKDFSINASSNVGGLIGYADSTEISNVIAIGEVIGGSNTGGIVGAVGYSSSLRNCYFQGKVMGEENVGGVIGNGGPSVINNIFAHAQIIPMILEGGENIIRGGGLAGKLSNGTLSNSHFIGTIGGEKSIGGITGFLTEYNDGVMKIENSYASAVVDAVEEPQGGFIGKVIEGTVVSSFFDITTYGSSEGVGETSGSKPFDVTGVATGTFASKNTFTGWDFENTWEIATISSIDTNPRPYLQWMKKTVSYSVEGSGGTLSTGTQKVFYTNTAPAVTATPAAGYRFAGWKDASGIIVSTESSFGAPDIRKNSSFTAVFALDDYSVIFVAGTGGTLVGTATQNVKGGASASAVTAIVPAGHMFAGWIDSEGTLVSTENPVKFTGVTGNIAVTAAYTINTFGLIYTAGANGIITGEVAQTVKYNTASSVVTATPNTGSHFVNWTDTAGVVAATIPDLTLLNIVGSNTYTANFAVKRHSASSAVAVGSGSVVVSASELNYGESVTYTVTPTAGFALDSVYRNGVNVTAEIVVAGAGYTYASPVTQDDQMTAFFSLIPVVDTVVDPIADSTLGLIIDPVVDIVDTTGPVIVDSSGVAPLFENPKKREGMTFIYKNSGTEGRSLRAPKQAESFQVFTINGSLVHKASVIESGMIHVPNSVPHGMLFIKFH